MILRRKREIHLTQPETVTAAVSRLEVLTDRLEETTVALRTMLTELKREEAPPR